MRKKITPPIRFGVMRLRSWNREYGGRYLAERVISVANKKTMPVPRSGCIRTCEANAEEGRVRQVRDGSVALLLSAMLAAAPLWGCGTSSTRPPAAQSESSANPALLPEQLSAEGQASLRAIIQAGNLSDLRWPDFSDYAKHAQKFYESYGYALPWVRGMGPSPQAQQVIAVLLSADEKGLSAEDYDGPRWHDRLAKLRPSTAQPSEADAVRFDAALTVCLMRYISDVHIGKVNPKHFAFGLDVETKKYDLPEFLRDNVVESADAAGALVQVEPPFPGYQRTVRALHNYLQLAKESDGKPLPTATKTIAPGDAYAGVGQLAKFLQAVGDLPANATVAGDAAVYQGALVDAVKNFQRRHGRTADGRIDAQTLTDLNVPLTARVHQMQLTLERWRWIPVSLHSAPIVANIPEFRVRAYDENFKVALSMNVVVGKAYRHTTPVFEDTMQYVIFRPYWSVPFSIAKGEILPHLASDPDYLAKKGFEVVDSRQEIVTSGAVSSDVLQQLRGGKLFIREKPGPKNSLGLLKFIFPNNYDVYMHDSPEHELFAKSRRDFSHGCVRLERPADMAVWVLRNNPGWDLERVRATMNGEATLQVNLAHPIPVLIVYGTAIVPEDGQVYFFDDIYGYDADLEKVLEKGYPYPG
jgi:murein L,D-transpeptidase YcbB/YkuD